MGKNGLKNEDRKRERAANQLFKRQRGSLTDIVPTKRSTVVTITSQENDDKPAPAFLSSHGDKKYAQRPLKTPRRWKKWVVFSGITIVGFGAIFASLSFSSAEIRLTLKQLPWEYRGEINALVSNGDISAQILKQSKNLQLSFPASGKRHVERKARGIMTVYNAYSSAPQKLVASTRFISPDGKIFRLDQAVTVPGAQIVDGKIIPASVEVSVSADIAGDNYNIGPVSKWTIPGFKGTPKYDGFYGVSQASMEGGIIGEIPVPTDADIVKAKEAANKAIKDSLASAFAISVPQDLTMLDGGSNVTIVKEAVLDSDGRDGTFKYFIEAKDERIAVKQSDIAAFILKKAKAALGSDIEQKNAEQKFSLKKLSVRNGAINGAAIAVDFSGVFVRTLDKNVIKNRAMGLSERNLDSLAQSLPAIEKITVSLWPFWVKTVPKQPDRINIVVD